MKHSAVSIPAHINVNLDRYFVDEDKQIFAVCDGTTAGGQLSYEFVDLLVAFIEERVKQLSSGLEEATAFFAKLIEDADRIIPVELKDYYGNRITMQGVGSTLVLGCLIENNWVIANSGDSKAFLIRGDNLVEVGYSDSQYNQWIETGLVKVVEGKPRFDMLKDLEPLERLRVIQRADRRMIRWIGNGAIPHINSVSFQSDGILVLCSDGAEHPLEPEEMINGSKAVRSGELEHLLEAVPWYKPEWRPGDDATAIVIWEG